MIASYMDTDKINCAGDCGGGCVVAMAPKLRYCFSVGAICGESKERERGEAKKAMPADKLAELWIADPKRAKRILANRQSAARSKERKARHIIELEKKVGCLQTEATTLSVQLSLIERDTKGLTTENTELRCQLESMEQQAQLRDALNEALKHELERLKMATGETKTTTDAYILPLQPIHYNSSFSSQPQSDTIDLPKSRLPPLHLFEPNISNSHHPIDFSGVSNLCALDDVKLSQFLPFEAKPKSTQFCLQEAPILTYDSLPLEPPTNTKTPEFYPLEMNVYFPQHPVDLSSEKLQPFDFRTSVPCQQQLYITPESQLVSQITQQDHLSKLQGIDVMEEPLLIL